MERKYKIILAVFVLVFAAVVFLEASQPEPINWSPSYSRLDKIPLGSYVFYESLKEKFPGQLRETRQPPFEFLKDTSISGTYLFLNGQIGFGEAELNRLLDWAKEGNTVFVSAKFLGNKLQDTLNLQTAQKYLYNHVRTQPLLNFSNPKLKSDSAYHYKHNIGTMSYFFEIDTLNNVVLGVADLYAGSLKINDSLINFIKVPIGKGEILLHLMPEAFGNYFMLLENNHEYAEKAMAYIDTDQPIYWDGRYKAGRPLITSPLSILLGNKYLKWAYYFVLIGTILFVFFEGKRKQKSIAVVPPLTNKSREFADTISGMYLEQKDHKAIAEKEILMFLEYLRANLRVDTQKFDKAFFETLADRSGKTKEEAQGLFRYIARIQKQGYVDKKGLLDLNERIENFKRP